jgi:hypothetical protein
MTPKQKFADTIRWAPADGTGGLQVYIGVTDDAGTFAVRENERGTWSVSYQNRQGEYVGQFGDLHSAEEAEARAPELLRSGGPSETRFVTFGLKYRQEEHPTLGPIVDPDGWLEIRGLSAETARSLAFALTGGMHMTDYGADRFKKENHTAGAFMVVDVSYPGGI